MNAMPDWSRSVPVIEALVKEVVAEILGQEDYAVQAKGRQDLVTDLDYAMEREIKRRLQSLFPTDHFIGEEENHEDLGPERTWVCDPIDGTVNFVQGLPYYGVTLALLVERQPVFTLIYLPELDETYTAIRSQGAFLNGQKLETNRKRELANSIVTFGDFSKSNPTSRPFQIRAMSILMEKALRVRIQGASSVDFAFLAADRNSCHILFSNSLWEVAPGTLLAQEAGCVTTTLNGQDYGFRRHGLVIASNHQILDQVVRELDQGWRSV
ncbi:MAG: inositol monophosphatase [Clostridia bacterium]|nr:inositol monophosphatase [Clostridia bacterium]NCC77030.1 inositol monophosphatase [Clostridia bacterium]